jgi:hypothetical protein
MIKSMPRKLLYGLPEPLYMQGSNPLGPIYIKILNPDAEK